MEKNKDRAKELSTDMTLSEEQLRSKFGGLIAEKNKSLGAILTKEQFENLYLPQKGKKNE